MTEDDLVRFEEGKALFDKIARAKRQVDFLLNSSTPEVYLVHGIEDEDEADEDEDDDGVDFYKYPNMTINAIGKKGSNQADYNLRKFFGLEDYKEVQNKIRRELVNFLTEKIMEWQEEFKNL